MSIKLPQNYGMNDKELKECRKRQRKYIIFFIIIGIISLSFLLFYFVLSESGFKFVFLILSGLALVLSVFNFVKIYSVKNRYINVLANSDDNNVYHRELRKGITVKNLEKAIFSAMFHECYKKWTQYLDLFMEIADSKDIIKHLRYYLDVLPPKKNHVDFLLNNIEIYPFVCKFYLGKFYYEGLCVKKDVKKGLKIYRELFSETNDENVALFLYENDSFEYKDYYLILAYYHSSSFDSKEGVGKQYKLLVEKIKNDVTKKDFYLDKFNKIDDSRYCFANKNEVTPELLCLAFYAFIHKNARGIKCFINCLKNIDKVHWVVHEKMHELERQYASYSPDLLRELLKNRYLPASEKAEYAYTLATEYGDATYYREAGDAFEFLKQYKKAAECYKAHWKNNNSTNSRDKYFRFLYRGDVQDPEFSNPEFFIDGAKKGYEYSIKKIARHLWNAGKKQEAAKYYLIRTSYDSLAAFESIDYTYMAIIYHNGYGVEKNLFMASQCIKRVENLGIKDAISFLWVGYFYRYGLGRHEKSLKKALDYFKKGAALGNKECKEYISGVEKEIKELEAKEAERKAMQAEAAKKKAEEERVRKENEEEKRRLKELEEEKRRLEKLQEEQEHHDKYIYYHSGTEVEVVCEGATGRHDGFGFDQYKYVVYVTFYFKNVKGDTKTKETCFGVESDDSYNFTVSDAEYRYKYVLHPTDDSR